MAEQISTQKVLAILKKAGCRMDGNKSTGRGYAVQARWKEYPYTIVNYYPRIDRNDLSYTQKAVQGLIDAAVILENEGVDVRMRVGHSAEEEGYIERCLYIPKKGFEGPAFDMRYDGAYVPFDAARLEASFAGAIKKEIDTNLQAEAEEKRRQAEVDKEKKARWDKALDKNLILKGQLSLDVLFDKLYDMGEGKYSGITRLQSLEDVPLVVTVSWHNYRSIFNDDVIIRAEVLAVFLDRRGDMQSTRQNIDTTTKDETIFDVLRHFVAEFKGA